MEMVSVYQQNIGKLNKAQMSKFVFKRPQNNVGKGENAACQHFLFLSSLFSKCFFSRIVETYDRLLNSLPNNKILHWTKSKACEEDKKKK